MLYRKQNTAVELEKHTWRRKRNVWRSCFFYFNYYTYKRTKL